LAGVPNQLGRRAGSTGLGKLLVSSLGGAGDGGAHIGSWFALDDGLDGWALDGAGADAGSVEGGSAEGGSAEGGSAEGDPAEGGSSEGGSAEGGSGGGAKHLSMAAPIPKASGPAQPRSGERLWRSALWVEGSVVTWSLEV